MNHCTRSHRTPRRIGAALLVAGGLLAAASTAAAGDSIRVDLLAQAGSSQAVDVHYRHGGHGRGGPHRGPKHRGHGSRYDYGHGHALRERAHRYATTAVRQAREARALGYYSDHPRWRTGYQRHYRWALQAAPHRIEDEIRRRARKLRALRNWGPAWADSHYGYDHRHGPHCRH